MTNGVTSRMALNTISPDFQDHKQSLVGSIKPMNVYNGDWKSKDPNWCPTDDPHSEVQMSFFRPPEGPRAR